MASGDLLIPLNALHAISPATNGGRHDKVNEHPVVDFQATTANELIVFPSLMMPPNYGGGGITVYIHYAMSSATSNAVKWDVFFERIGDQQQNITSDGFATEQSVTVTVPATAGLVDVTSIAFTDGAQIDSIAVGEGFRLKLERDQADAADTASGDAEFWGMRITET